MESKFLLEVMLEKLTSMKIHSYSQLVRYIDRYNNQEDEKTHQKNTGFDEDIIIVLDVITIYLKMREAKVLANSGRLDKGYQKFKKELYEKERERIAGLLSDKLTGSWS